MKAVVYIHGVIGVDTTLISVIRQVNSFKKFSEVEVVIDSVGGSVTEGQDIFSYLRNLKVPITTVAKQAYSIACTIFMAGDVRIVEDNGAPLMIHFPLAQNLTANSETLDYVSAELKKLENDFADFYAIYLNIPKETITALLKAETFISAEDAVSMGFATEIMTEQLKAVAFFDDEEEKQKNKFKMKVEKLMDAIAQKLGISEPEVETEIEISAVVIQDANGQEVEFPDLDEGDAIEVGVKALIDNLPAEGAVVNIEGETWVFEAGILIEILPTAEEVEEVEEEIKEEIDMEALVEDIISKVSEKFKTENEALKAELVAVKKLLGSSEPEINPIEQKQNSYKKKNLAQMLTKQK